MSQPQIGTTEGYDGREIVVDAASGTTLALFVRDSTGALITPTAPTLVLNYGNAKLTLTPTAASGSLSCAITAANLVTLGANVTGVGLQLFWQCTLSGVTEPVRFSEYCWVAPSKVYPPVNVTRHNARYPELNSASSLPSGQSNWYGATGADAWVMVRNWAALRGKDRMMWMIQNPQALADLYLEWWWLNTCMLQATQLDGSKIWGDRCNTHMAALEQLKADLTVFFATAPPTAWTDSVAAERKTIKEPVTVGGHNRARGRGKL